MKRSTITFILMGMALLAGLALAATMLGSSVAADTTAVDAANQLHAAGHYNEAIKLYEEQVARGVQDSALYYNLGNAYYQQGDVGRAVLNLERAAQLNPRDEDIANNLALVREQTTELFVEEPSGPVAALAAVTGWLTINETAVLLLGFWFLLGFLLLMRQQAQSAGRQRALRIGLIVVAAALLITGASLASREFLQNTQPPGVVVSPTVAISNGPGVEYATEHKLQGGATVNIEEQDGDWVRVQTPEGSGDNWLPAAAIEPVSTAHLTSPLS